MTALQVNSVDPCMNLLICGIPISLMLHATLYFIALDAWKELRKGEQGQPINKEQTTFLQKPFH